AAEYSRWYVGTNSTDLSLFPETSSVSERAYGSAAYRFRSWLQGGLYYSLLYPKVSSETRSTVGGPEVESGTRTGRANMQHDVAATARFDINPYWLLKAEIHYMQGTAGLTPSLNDGRPTSVLERDWAVFLLKTTAYF